MKERIYLSSPHLSGKEMKYIQEAFDTNWVAPLGPNVDAFEKELSDYLHINHVAALSSGTAAIHLALINLGVTSGDKVIVSSFTFSASVNPIVYQNATPILVDSERETWNMSPELLVEAIKENYVAGKKPKAIILVHLYGMPAKVEEIIDIANQYEIPVIEDAAEALGSEYKNKKIGTFGVMGIFSFNGNKIITTSGGGALASNNEDYIKNARFLATQARDKYPYYHHTKIGYNYRMSNVVAGIGRGQLEVLNDRVKKRRAVHEFYLDLFKNIDGIEFHHTNNPYFFSNYWLTCITINPKKTGGITNHDLMRAFEEENIESRYLWKPMHTQPVFASCPKYVNGVSEDLFNYGLCLPSGSNLTDEHLERIANCVKKVFKL